MEFAGASTSSPSGGTVITFSGGVPASLDQTYFLKITSGDHEGWWSTVISSDDGASTITVNDTFPSTPALPAATAVAVRKHNTVLSFLGANNPGLNPYDSTFTVTPDEVQLLNPPDSVTGDQAVTSIIYATVAGERLPNGWYYAADFSDANGQVIEPATALMIKNFQGGDLTFQSVGDVRKPKRKWTSSERRRKVGSPPIAQPQGAGSTLDETGLPAAPPQMISLTAATLPLVTSCSSWARTPRLDKPLLPTRESRPVWRATPLRPCGTSARALWLVVCRLRKAPVPSSNIRPRLPPPW